MVYTKQCNINNFYNRKLFYIRYILFALLNLVIRISNDPEYRPLAGPMKFDDIF